MSNRRFRFWLSFSDFGCLFQILGVFFRLGVLAVLDNFFQLSYRYIIYTAGFQILGVFFRFKVSFSDFGCPSQILDSSNNNVLNFDV